jgi:hypothetical protein
MCGAFGLTPVLAEPTMPQSKLGSACLFPPATQLGLFD